jgi:cell division protein FtsB
LERTILLTFFLAQLRKENNQLKLENSQLFKELDILNRKVRTKFGTTAPTPRKRTTRA